MARQPTKDPGVISFPATIEQGGRAGGARGAGGPYETSVRDALTQALGHVTMRLGQAELTRHLAGRDTGA